MSSTELETTTNSSPDMFGDIRAFHEKYGIDYAGPPRALPVDVLQFRMKFMFEELDEYDEDASLLSAELSSLPEKSVCKSLELQLDALVDLVYVALGTAYLHGFDFNEAWRRVHAANMLKVRATKDGSDSKRGSSHDVVKPKGWKAPDHSDLVANHAHKEQVDAQQAER